VTCEKETTFILAMFIVSPLAGLAITLVLMMIAIPQFTQYQLTFQLKRQTGTGLTYGNLMLGLSSWILLAAASLGIVTIIMLLFLRLLESAKHDGLIKWRSVAGAKLLVVFLLSLAWLYLLVNESGSFYITQRDISKSIQFGIYVIGTAGLWLVAGEQGWAGDLSSWRMPHDAKPVWISPSAQQPA
jgi:hypothetical protein